MAAAYKVVSGSDFINVVISSSSPECALCVEKRFKKDITIADLKGKLEMITGGNPTTMQVMVYDNDDKEVCQLSDDAALFGSYPIDDGMRLHVVDQFVLRSQIGENAEGDKYEMKYEEYAKRPDTVRAFLAQNRLGKYNEEEMKKKEEERLREEAEEEAAANAIKVGDRCEITMPGAPKRRGTVRYVGLTDFKKGWWIGVQYDEPLGKNDGSADGRRYFECPPKYGGFLKPAFVTTGDFPEEEFDLDEM